MRGRFAVLALLLALGCGPVAGHPDTGAGAGQTPPATVTCAELCQRVGSCGVILCNEDTRSNHYDGMDALLGGRCSASCTDVRLQSLVNPTSWACVYQSSCRQVFEYDACHLMSSYSCD